MLIDRFFAVLRGFLLLIASPAVQVGDTKWKLRKNIGFEQLSNFNSSKNKAEEVYKKL